ncbi:MAG: TonB family protein, partial [Chitinophagales bacterium]
MIITYILQVTLCLAFFYALYHAVLHKETLFRTNRIYLLSTLVASLTLPLIRIYILDHQHEVSIVTSPIYVGSYLESMNEVIVAPHQHAFPWLGVLTALYKGVVIFLVCRILESVLSILRIQRVGEKIFLYGQKCVISPKVKSPFSFFNTIYLPKGHQFSESELEEIITHEKTHVQGRHTLDVLFVELVCSALWLSPMVYLYRKKLRELHEFLADAEVLKNTPWENYASFLIAQKDEGLQQRLSNQLIYSQLKNRLVMMNKQRSFRSAKYKYLAIIPILFLALVIFSFREKSEAQNNSELSKNHVYNIYNDGLKVYTFSQPIVLTITDDKKYLLNSKEVAYDSLGNEMVEVTKNMPDPRIILQLGKSVTVDEASKIMMIGEKVNIQMVLESPSHHPDLAKFLIVVEKTDNELKLTCKDGCAWKSLTFNSSSFDEPQAIDQYGMTTVSATQPVNDPEHPNFLFTIKGEGNGVNLIGIAGTAWTKLSFARPKSLWMQAIDQFGMTTIDEEGHSTSVAHLQYYPQDTLPATVVTAYRFAEPSPDVDSSIEYKPDPDIYEDVAIFPGCEDVPIKQRVMCGQTNLMSYINSHLIYPESLKKANIQGKVFVRFTVGINGYVKNTVIEKSLNPDADDAVLNVFENMNKEAGRWLPARKGGKTMEAEMTLPVSFSLGTAEEKTVWDEPYTMVEQMPRFPGCEEFTKTIKSSDISKGDFSIPRGSVKVTSG